GFNVGRITGGLGAGILLATLSPNLVTAAGLTLLVAAVLQGLPSIPIWRIRVTETTARSASLALLAPLVESARYVLRYPTLGAIVLMSIGPGALGLSYQFMLLVVIRDLGSPADAVGLLYAGGGAGGLLA